MNKLILIAIVLVIIVVLLGLYFIFLNSNKDTVTPQGQTNSGALRTFDAKGVTVQVLKEGTGAEVKDGDSITVHYEGALADGTTFDSSIDKKRPYTFTLGRHSVPMGFELGVVGMKTGEKRKLTVPPELGYGSQGFITVPPNATLTFEIELLKIN